MKRKTLFWLGLICWVLSIAPLPAMARVWEVGPGRKLTGPGQVAGMVEDGDRVVFDPGIYRECAIWKASRLTIEARRAPPAMNQTVMSQSIITGPTCADRALFLFTGNDITVRGMVFLQARGTGHNAAGILMEGANLTVENSLFQDNENGILTGGPANSVVRVRTSWFRGNGSCQGSCAHALYVGMGIAGLEVTGCTFVDTHVGHHIKSRARMTIVRDSRIEDGPTGTSSYLIELPNGGGGEIVNNLLRKGPRSDNREAAISIGTETTNNPASALEIRGNRFTNELPVSVRFVRNSTQTPARLRGNVLVGPVVALDGPGTVE
ncbi:MAG: hypothetical protein EXR07_04705 [Acetobacteraceae bacterium]|nr:hypothetical protein [Acetobacteraceae bacterium]